MNLKRREFSKVVAGVALASTALLSPVAHAQARKPVAGKDYGVLAQTAPVDAPAGKVEVVEFFSYACGHCKAFQPVMHEWSKRAPKDVVIRRVPVSFLQNPLVFQRLYFSLEAMNLVEKLHAGVFAAVHDERRSFNDAAAAADWVASKGGDRAKFLEHFNSFTVANKATKASQLTNAYKIEGTPALGVAGRFLTEGTDKGLQTVEALVAEIKAGR